MTHLNRIDYMWVKKLHIFLILRVLLFAEIKKS